MFNSFSTALSGLNANSASLAVIGNNLANMNTVGYKASVIQFEELLAATVLSYNGTGNPMQVGLGVMPASITSNFAQGSLQTTGIPTDVAVVGAGFFVVSDGDGYFYTRAGNFALDAEGYLLTQEGKRVQGYPAVQGAVDPSASLGDIRIDPGTMAPAIPTSVMRVVSNLSASLAVGSTFKTSVQLVDSLGGSHTVTLEFTRQAPVNPGDPPSFGFDVTVEGGDVVGGTAGVPFSLLTGADATTPPPGTMAFDSNGRLTLVDPGTGPLSPPADITINIPGFSNGAAAQSVTLDLVSDGQEAYLTAYATPSSTSSTYQDGAPAANLLTFSVLADGTVQGVFTNGDTYPLGQIAIAQFNNPQGLVRLGANEFAQSASSGEPSIGVPGTGGRGSLSGGTLELSNVDIGVEFTNLIMAQRGYQASSRVVTTTDELLQEAINLKR